MIIGEQYLESGTYSLSLEPSYELDIVSYIYTKFGTFRIVPISGDVADFYSLERYDVYLENGLIGSVTLELSEGDVFSAANAMAAAIDIVSTKINEFIDKYERAVLSKIAHTLFDSINLTDEQKALYRTFVQENNLLPDIISEIETPTDILGVNE